MRRTTYMNIVPWDDNSHHIAPYILGCLRALLGPFRDAHQGRGPFELNEAGKQDQETRSDAQLTPLFGFFFFFFFLPFPAAFFFALAS